MLYVIIFFFFILVFTFAQVLMARIHVREIQVVPYLLLRMTGEVEATKQKVLQIITKCFLDLPSLVL